MFKKPEINFSPSSWNTVEVPETITIRVEVSIGDADEILDLIRKLLERS